MGIQERGRELDHVLHQYTTLVKPAFEEFCIPTKKFADVIVPRGAENIVAIDLIVQHIQDIIWRSNGSKAGSPLSRSRSNSDSKIRLKTSRLGRTNMCQSLLPYN